MPDDQTIGASGMSSHALVSHATLVAASGGAMFQSGVSRIIETSDTAMLTSTVERAVTVTAAKLEFVWMLISVVLREMYDVAKDVVAAFITDLLKAYDLWPK